MTELLEQDPPRTALRDRRWPRLGLSLVAGLLIAAAVPPLGWWPLAIAGIALWGWLLDRAKRGERFWVGAMVAIGWFEPSMLWMVKFSPVGWPLGVAVWFGVVCGLTSMLCPPGRFRLAALFGLVVCSEWLRWHAPFGGVPLSMLAMSQARGPLLPVARVFGSLGVSAAVAALGVAAAALVDRRWRTAGITTVLVVAVALFGVWAPRGHAVRTIDTAAVQGGGPQGTRSETTDYAQVFQRHLDASSKIPAGTDLVVWPENVVNVSAYEGSFQQSRMQQLARDLHATVVVGIVEDAGPDHFLNAAIAIGPDGQQLGRYDKVRRVPYGEYVPLRFLLDPIAHDLLPPRDQIAGKDPNVLVTPAGRLGVVISWEVFFGRRVRDAMHHDAQLILNPTNGSSYWLTQVQTQQLASSSLRAVESGRWLVQAAPTGFSAVVDPSGTIVGHIPIGKAGVLAHPVELRDGDTIAVLVGDVPALALAALAIAFAWLATRRVRGSDLR